MEQIWIGFCALGACLEPWVVIIGVFAGLGFWRSSKRSESERSILFESLETAFEARSAIAAIRSPISFGHEVPEDIRDKIDELTPNQKAAAVVTYRWRQHTDTFAKLQKARFRLKARFGADVAESLEGIFTALRLVSTAAQMLGIIRDEDRASDSTRINLRKWESHIWSGYGIDDEGNMTKEDEVDGLVEASVEKLEARVQELLKE